MRIGIIDSDLIGRTKHRFPNLACMKISGYHKTKGDSVSLITQYPKIYQELYKLYDKLYVSKVFIDTAVPYEILNLSITEYGGTGFYYGDAIPLKAEIESHKPDYHLYDEWIVERKQQKFSTDEFSYYEDYSLGFSTRGCVRQCKFCINQHCTKVEKASPIKEFLDDDKPYICLLDDNVLAYENWREIFDELNSTGKTFEFKQGLDIRSLTEEKAKIVANSKININTVYFAFDNIKDKDIVDEKLKLWRKYYKKNTHVYVLCGFDEENKYDEEFWAKDIENTLERIRICIKYGVFPYIMRYRMYNSAIAPYRGMYINLSAWCNQKSLFSKSSINEWADNIQKANEKQLNKKRLYSSKRYLMEYAGKHPELAYQYFDLKYNEHNEFVYEKDMIVNTSRKTHDSLNKTSIQKIKNKAKNKDIRRRSYLNKEKRENIIHSIKSSKEFEENINILKWFQTKEAEINNGLVVNYNVATVQAIKTSSVDLILLNIKEEIEEKELALIKHCHNYLKNTGHFYICNSNIKTFNNSKEFIEKNTSLKYRNSINFKDGKEMKICSYYNYIDDFIAWDDNICYKDKNLLFKSIIEKSSKEKDIILSFFNRYDFIDQFAKQYLNRSWICVKKTRGTKGKWEHNNIMTLKQDKSAQTSLLESEDKNIG